MVVSAYTLPNFRLVLLALDRTTLAPVTKVAQPLPSDGRLLFFALKSAVLVNPQTLAVLGRIAIGTDTLRVLLSAITADSTGLVVGDTYEPSGCVACNQYADGFVVLDPATLGLVAELAVGVPVGLVP